MDTALLAFDVDGLHQGRLLRPFDALSWMEALESTLERLVPKQGGGSSCFIANKADEPRGPTPHSTLFLPISHDARRARLDQVLIHSPRGFDAEARAALAKLRQIEGPFGVAMVILVELGPKAEFVDKVDHFRQSKVWQSVTPIVSFLSAAEEMNNGFEHHLRAELIMHGFPPCSRIDVLTDRGRYAKIEKFEEALVASVGGLVGPESARTAMNVADQEQKAFKPPVFGLRLEFDEMVQGPLALGRWARYGMGQFLPA